MSRYTDLASVALADYVGRDCPASPAKMDEMRDAISALAHAIYDLDARLDASESNLDLARARIAALEGAEPVTSTPLGIVSVLEADEGAWLTD